MTRLLVTVLALSTGCTELRTDIVCDEVCTRLNVCDDSVAVSECVDECSDEVGQCNADTQSETLSQLDQCGDDSCSDIDACIVGAYLECNFGDGE